MKFIWINFIRTFRNFFRILHNLWLKIFFGYIDITSIVSPKSRIYGKSGIYLGKKTVIHPYATLRCSTMAKLDKLSHSIKIGDNTILQPYSYLHTDGGNILIGNNCTVNAFAVLYGQGGLRIGDNVRIATQVAIVPSNHIFDSLGVPIYQQGSEMKGVVIGDDVWIGAGAKILDGVHIADGCVIGAGSVVVASTEKNGIYVGVPAKLMRFRGE